jgi:hypothetical protein
MCDVIVANSKSTLTSYLDEVIMKLFRSPKAQPPQSFAALHFIYNKILQPFIFGSKRIVICQYGKATIDSNELDGINVHLFCTKCVLSLGRWHSPFKKLGILDHIMITNAQTL